MYERLEYLKCKTIYPKEIIERIFNIFLKKVTWFLYFFDKLFSVQFLENYTFSEKKLKMSERYVFLSF